MFVDEEGVYKISINTMREMEKKDENLIFLKEKLSLFIKCLAHLTVVYVLVLENVQWIGI